MTNSTHLTVGFFIFVFLLGCSPQSRRLDVRVVQSVKLDKAMGFSVLRAPDLDGVDASTLPVILFLHGMGSDHLAFDKFGVSDAIYSAMAAGEIPPAHLIFPNGERGFYLNWHDGSHPYEDYILQEVMPAAEAALGVQKSVSRHIAGVSMGGIGTLQIGLRHPEIFSSVSCISALILTREEALEMMNNRLIRLFAPTKRIWGDGTDDGFSAGIDPYKLVVELRPAPKLFLAYGTKDKKEIRQSTRRFHENLQRLGVPHRFVVYPGEHTWDDWVPVIRQAIVAAIQDTNMKTASNQVPVHHGGQPKL